ncbi:biopolymer transporter ExbD [Candidatus Methylacidiphilum fumarolicum]|uniref:Biopolymer transport protein n=2 Tax=Candidatus Methylacidiphilum fumarolicum TaxID=591154 RepID=I0K034_METFB|nr:biopolymer transporter ExbD [Candidatus Methylacidiphilum fumarolicum]MBW6415122.1 biopolymer transporter ExbD [Candidatus Methylacidiphilum fumarolicum]TFE65996.1 biopolymer transporter [Candidatus Methylacidiphilum fumarolicum]TFE72724.1 biopolymer transporter ExbD [Candidatus Methylacidiphilum fumarolicum]TFE73190.1 biopolymer transporter ExbD [Candidatus Methylacidiphilum fumarolicum]TFE77596.1 biopolymer transporter [Candidatus Methylacidiphilum fumarolicum]
MKIHVQTEKHRPRLEIIPFIDVMFFLLATFMIVSLTMVKNETIQIKLPKSTTAVSQPPPDQITVKVLEEGNFLFDKEKVLSQELTSKLNQIKTSNPDPKIFVTGEPNASFELVVKIIDEARKIGINKIAIQTTKPQSQTQKSGLANGT